MKSVEEFRTSLKEKLIELHWKQWRTLGISSHIEETKHIIDLEALIVSSLFIGNYDKRLLSSSLEWITKNKEWIGASRIKQVGKHFLKKDKQLKKGLVHNEPIEFVLGLLKDRVGGKGLEKINEETIPEDYKSVLLKLEDRNVTAAPVIQKYPLLQLYFRGIFGINARAEIFLYLLLEGKGNSNGIAREIYYDQKIVYRILKRWAAAGFIREETGKKETLYFLKNGRNLAKNIKPRGHYVNWCKVFYLFSRLLTFAHTEPWAEDRYLLSSLFRDVSEEAGVLGRYFDRVFPGGNLYEGEDFFPPFASAVLQILDKINDRK
jgi:DNA-binding MarR family transcriptional regulator